MCSVQKQYSISYNMVKQTYKLIQKSRALSHNFTSKMMLEMHRSVFKTVSFTQMSVFFFWLKYSEKMVLIPPALEYVFSPFPCESSPLGTVKMFKNFTFPAFTLSFTPTLGIQPTFLPKRGKTCFVAIFV